MSLIDWFRRNCPEDTLESRKAAVAWLRASVFVKTGPAFMPDDHAKCVLILNHIDALEEQTKAPTGEES